MELVTGDWHEITYRWEVLGKTIRCCKQEPVLWVVENICVFESGYNNENFSSCHCSVSAAMRIWEWTWRLLNVRYLYEFSSKWA